MFQNNPTVQNNEAIDLENLYNEIDLAQSKKSGKNFTTPIKVPVQTQDLNDIFNMDPWTDQNDKFDLFDEFQSTFELNLSNNIPSLQQEQKSFAKSGSNLDELILRPTRKKSYLELNSDNFYDDSVGQDDFFDEFLDTYDQKDLQDESDNEEIPITSIYFNRGRSK